MADTSNNGPAHKPLTYQEASELAKNGKDGDRAQLATRSDLKPELLYFLAEDPSANVRRNVAANEATPGQADIVLARDKEDVVREDLAGKIARLVPNLDPSDQSKLYQTTMDALEILARDQVTHVRQILAEALKDVAHAPPSVINRLARDAELVVAEPILTFSPVLTDEDLLDIISTSKIAGVLDAISNRKTVTEVVADAIVESDAVNPIAVLLGNKSAQIREETLDALIERAPDITSWHLPLVTRPKLPFGAALRLAKFVAESLVSALQDRGDVSKEDVGEIRKIVDKRIDAETFDPDWKKKSKPGVVDVDDLKEDEDEKKANPGVVDLDDLKDDDDDKKKKKPVTPLEIARDMEEKNTLNDDAIETAIKRGDVDFVIAAISVLSRQDMKLIDKAFDLDDAEVVVTLCWKAGLDAKLAEAVQEKVAGIKGDRIVKAKGKSYKLKREELESKLKFIKRLNDE